MNTTPKTPTAKPRTRAMTPEQAAEALDAEGIKVTARAVRERSGVRMAEAVAAAKAWNERAAAQGNAPEIPNTVQNRFEAMWAEAYAAAAESFEEARTGWAAKIDRSEAEQASLAKVVDELETTVDELRTKLEETRTAGDQAAAAAAAEIDRLRTLEATEVAAYSEQLGAERTRAAKAEGALEAITAERDRLLTEIAQLRDQGRPGKTRS